MAVSGQIVKLIPKKLIEKLKNKYKIQTRSFSATDHAVAMLYAQLSHALSLNDICDCLRFHAGYLSQIRDCVPPSRNGLAHANASREPKMAEELFWSVLAEIKQTLQLAGFLIASENAIKWQIWTALLPYLLLRLVGWQNGNNLSAEFIL